jgi:hypothetical protein
MRRHRRSPWTMTDPFAEHNSFDVDRHPYIEKGALSCQAWRGLRKVSCFGRTTGYNVSRSIHWNSFHLELDERVHPHSMGIYSETYWRTAPLVLITF